ncbi:tRNA (guanine(9)-N1)-methyltransferase [Leucoagaricus sp. SymC.cos]|nr:tRNA (guanine(9)-N1)-methyltransferase [Leucoagaricus sp. SymC.cos]
MDPSTQPAPLSKSAQKKAARAARLAELKLERRAREKEAKKEKKRIRAEKRAAGELDDEDEAEKVKQKKKPRVTFGGRVVVDLGFDHLMSEKEVKSLCSQLAYTYSANRNASFPFSLLFTCLNGRMLGRLRSLNDAGYKRWAKTEWWTEGETSNSGPICAKETIIYLTADSSEELEELKPDETYIIGGMVDRNRYKNLCESKAKEANIRTARLPIGKYLADLPTRKVLTVNQVFEILIKWAETRDWEIALNHVMPKRKFNAEGKHGKLKVGSDEDGSEEQVDDPQGIVVGNQEEGVEDTKHNSVVDVE